MRQFESLPVTKNIERENLNSLEKRMGTIKRLVRSFPTYKSLILAFITSTAPGVQAQFVGGQMGSQATTVEQSSITTENRETAETAPKKIDDQEFKSVVAEIEAQMNIIGSVIPENSLYTEEFAHKNINGEQTLTQKSTGSLPESANNVFIGTERISTSISLQTGFQQTGFQINTMNGIKSVFYMYPGTEGDILEGKKIETRGVGSTRAEALQNALEESILLFGLDVRADNVLENRDSKEAQNLPSELFVDTTSTKGLSYITEFSVIHGGETVNTFGITEYSVTIEVQGGQLIPQKL